MLPRESVEFCVVRRIVADSEAYDQILLGRYRVPYIRITMYLCSGKDTFSVGVGLVAGQPRADKPSLIPSGNTSCRS